MENTVKACMLLLVIALAIDTTAQVPTNARSIEVTDRNSPKLHERFTDLGLILGDPIFIRIFKEEHVLELWVQDSSKFRLFQSYPICTFSGDLGPKTQEGDLQSPEGFYFVTPSRMNPWSSFHLSMNLGYPNSYDRFHGYTGDYLMIHGACASIGCYAMTNEGIEEIYTIAEMALSNGQRFFRIHVFPFKMTTDQMTKVADSDWYPFWENLKSGYDWFEKNGIPPNVDVSGGEYVFN